MLYLTYCLVVNQPFLLSMQVLIACKAKLSLIDGQIEITWIGGHFDCFNRQMSFSPNLEFLRAFEILFHRSWSNWTPLCSQIHRISADQRTTAKEMIYHECILLEMLYVVKCLLKYKWNILFQLKNILPCSC